MCICFQVDFANIQNQYFLTKNRSFLARDGAISFHYLKLALEHTIKDPISCILTENELSESKKK